MWQVLQGTSLWARFAKAKFYHGNTFIKQRTSSPLWESIVSQWPRLSRTTQWVLGCGDICFCVDNWLGENLHGPLPCYQCLTIRKAYPIIIS